MVSLGATMIVAAASISMIVAGHYHGDKIGNLGMRQAPLTVAFAAITAALAKRARRERQGS